MPSAADSSPGEKRYNPIFERLVDQNPDHITGYVAYALYKQKKRDWIKDYQTRNGRNPNDEQLNEYTRAEELPRNLDSLTREAQAILDAYAVAITEAQYAELYKKSEENALVSRVAHTLRTVERQGGLGRQLFVSLISTLFSLFVLLLLASALAVFGIDIIDGAAKLRRWFSE